MLNPNEIRSQITDQIVEALTNGNLPPWRRPWANDPNAPGLHASLSTGNPYRGINQLLLQLSAGRGSFQSKWWGTFNQVKSSGAHVLKGAKGTSIILFKPVKRTRVDESGEERDDSFCVLRTFVVFNAEQTSGLQQYQVGFNQPKEDTGERHEQADAVIEATSADIRYGGNKAFYSPDGDYVQVPHRHQFETAEAFYETSFHELCHWSEKPVGFDRTQAENTYALGELIAEIGACFLMGELGLPTTSNLTNHAAYLKSWLTGMNNDPKFIFRAAAQASKAVEFVLSFSRDRVEVVEAAGDEIPF
jgi:antirestriction protein ArdC